MNKRLILFILVLINSSTLAYAQPLLRFNKGDRLKITIDGSEENIIVSGVQENILLFQRENSVWPEKIPISALRGIEIYSDRSRFEGAINRAGIGFVVGGICGVIAGFTQGSDPPCSGQEICFSLSAGSKAILGGILVGVGGAVIGSIVGTIYPGKTWKSVDSPIQIEMVLESGENVRCGISLHF